MIVEVVSRANPRDLGMEVAARLAQRALAGPQSWVLTGGSTAKVVYPALAAAGVDWSRVSLFFSDERAVPPTHAESNYELARATLLDPGGVPAKSVHRMHGEADDLARAARDYEAQLPATLDVALLGLGGDGHVASLFPGHALLAEKKHRVAFVRDAPKPPPHRLTLTMPALLAAREVWLVVTGAEKQGVVRALQDATSTLPGSRLVWEHPRVVLFVDAAAAS